MPQTVSPLELKQFLIATLHLEEVRPEDIDDDGPLFGTGLGLDSIDGLELHLALTKRYRLRPVEDPDRTHLASVNALVAYLNTEIAVP